MTTTQITPRTRIANDDAVFAASLTNGDIVGVAVREPISRSATRRRVMVFVQDTVLVPLNRDPRGDQVFVRSLSRTR